MNKENNIVIDVKIDEKEIQQWSKDNFERELTDIELNRVKVQLSDGYGMSSVRDESIDVAVQCSITNEYCNWTEVDKNYIKSLKK